MNTRDCFVPKQEENFEPAFFESPQTYISRDDYNEDTIQKKDRETTLDKYDSEPTMSNVKYTNSGMATAALRGVQSKDMYSDLFFSNENVDYIQKKIRMEIYNKSKFLVGKQNETELILIMRSIHIQYSRNLNDCSKEMMRNEISRIDDMVINFAVPRIISEVRQYFHYLSDASTMPLPLEHPKLLSNAGTKSLNPSLSIPFDRNAN